MGFFCPILIKLTIQASCCNIWISVENTFCLKLSFLLAIIQLYMISFISILNISKIKMSSLSTGGHLECRQG